MTDIQILADVHGFLCAQEQRTSVAPGGISLRQSAAGGSPGGMAHGTFLHGSTWTLPAYVSETAGIHPMNSPGYAACERLFTEDILSSLHCGENHAFMEGWRRDDIHRIHAVIFRHLHKVRRDSGNGIAPGYLRKMRIFGTQGPNACAHSNDPPHRNPTVFPQGKTETVDGNRGVMCLSVIMRKA